MTRTILAALLLAASGAGAAHAQTRPMRTADLNRRAGTARPKPIGDSQGRNAYDRQSAQYRAELADHARAMQDYSQERARYADRIASWRARANACEAGNVEACQGPE